MTQANLVITSVGFLLLPLAGYAQSCETLLSNGIFDISDISSETSLISSYSQWYCAQSSSSQTRSASLGVDINAIIESTPISLGLNQKASKSSESRSQYCSSYDRYSSLQQRVRDYAKTVSSRLLDSFDSCLRSEGLHVWIERTYDPKRFRFAAKLNSSGPVRAAKISGVELSQNLDCGLLDRADSEPLELIEGQTRRVVCTRSNNDAADITIERSDWDPVEGGALNISPITLDQSIFLQSAACVSLPGILSLPLTAAGLSLNGIRGGTVQVDPVNVQTSLPPPPPISLRSGDNRCIMLDNTQYRVRAFNIVDPGRPIRIQITATMVPDNENCSNPKEQFLKAEDDAANANQCR